MEEEGKGEERGEGRGDCLRFLVYSCRFLLKQEDHVEYLVVNFVDDLVLLAKEDVDYLLEDVAEKKVREEGKGKRKTESAG